MAARGFVREEGGATTNFEAVKFIVSFSNLSQ